MASEHTPLRIRQALIGWSSEENDRSVLDYVGMISHWATIESAFLLHVVRRFEDLAPFAHSGATGQELGAAWVKAMKQAVEQRVKDADRIFWEYEVREGRVDEELTLTATDLQADLVCMGRMEHASLAPSLARTVPQSLLIIPGAFRPRIGKILVGVDFSESSAKAFRHALALAAQLGYSVQITCLHLYELPEPRLAEREQAFRIFLKRNLPEGFPPVIQEILPFREDGIAATLSLYAREEQADLVIIGARERTEAEHLALGSVAESFIRDTSDIAIWVIR